MEGDATGLGAVFGAACLGNFVGRFDEIIDRAVIVCCVGRSGIAIAREFINLGCIAKMREGLAVVAADAFNLAKSES